MSRNIKWRMQRAAHLLLEGHSSGKVAEMLKARPETLSRWKKHPAFIEEYERVRTELCEDMRVKLWRLAMGAFEKMSESSMGGLDSQRCFNNALKFFKTIKIEQVFSPNSPSMSPEEAAIHLQTMAMEKKWDDMTRKKPIAEQLSDITDELLDTTQE